MEQDDTRRVFYDIQLRTPEPQQYIIDANGKQTLVCYDNKFFTLIESYLVVIDAHNHLNFEA